MQAADYYWVGGAANWSDLNHWRLGSSAGSIPSIVPSSADNIFFDANSGFAAGNNTVTLNANGFCNNMTWGAVTNNPRFVTANASFTVHISGNLVLNNTTTYQVIFAMEGTAPATLTTNGNVLGEFGMTINKPGSSLTLTDDLIVPATTNTAGTNEVTLTAGSFDITGKNVTIYQFNSQNDNTRTLEMTNANMICNLVFRWSGLNKTLNSTASTLFTGAFTSDGGTFNRVTATSAGGPNTIIINNSTFKSLTFSPPNNIYSDIGNGNSVDSLVFNLQGSIGNNNTVGVVLYKGIGFVGSGNTIGKITAQHNLQISGNNTVDSVLLASNRTTNFLGNLIINDYLFVAGAPCEAYTEINGDSTAGGSVNFAAGALVDISNVILTNINAKGPDAPFAVNGIDGGSNAGFTITEPSGSGTDLYWVGGAGDWNDKSHWSFTSGGAGGACVPFKYDNVFFDANSGLGGATVTTSGNSFCKNLTWAAGVGTTTFSESPSYGLRVYGSVTLRPTVTFATTILEFYGSDAATITTNGGGATSSLQFYIAKTGSGSVTLTDDWINNTNQASINFVSGGLNMAGRTVTCWIFVSNNNNTRHLDISNANITTNIRWIYLGANKTMTSTGSHITSHARFHSNAPNSSYPSVELTESRRETTSDFDIRGTTFGQLLFSNAASTALNRIYAGNTIRRLEYKGAGVIGDPGNNNIDSLILAGSRNYVFAGTNTVNMYFKAEAATCSGLTEIRGSGAATLAFQPGAEIHIANVYMQNMTATGDMTPIVFDGADAGNNTGWTINSAAGSARYWVGGSGDWNDPNHWSATSGGASGACIPTVADDVYFDAQSGFTAGSRTVTITNGNAYCHNLNWEHATNAPLWNKSTAWNMEIWGDSLILNPAATFTGQVYVKGANATFLKGNVQGDFDIFIDKPGGSLTLLNDYTNNLYNFGVVNGALNASGRTLILQGLDNTFMGSGNPFAIDISNSTITTGAWRFVGTIANHTLNATNSSITCNEFQTNGMHYDTVNVAGNAQAQTSINSATINTLTFTNPSNTSTIGINGSNNTIGKVEYKGSGTINGTNNVMDTLIFFPGNRYTLNAGSNTTVNDAWFGSGTPCRATEIVSSSSTVNATITKTNGDVYFDYVRLQRVTAAGAVTPFQTGSHTTDLGNNVNWNIPPYDGAAPIQGLGNDTTIDLAEFPYVLRTTGFFGSPSSQYTWSDGSTADTLLVTGPGKYSVDVNFVDGCNISDEINILGSSLPITLTHFNASLVDCQPHLTWKTADAVHFSHFVVEKSTDGLHYTNLATIPLAESVNSYSYIDETAGNDLRYYRLRLVDIDKKYTYSRVVPLYSNCTDRSIRVYPAITSNQVNVLLPAGYENARLTMVNAMGQQIVPDVQNASGSVRMVSLKTVPAGVYVLQVINGKELRSFRIVKQ